MKDQDIQAVMRLLKKDVQQMAIPVVTEMSHNRHSPFHILVSTLLSLRTKDDTTRAATERLLKQAADPEAILALPEETIQELIYPVGFYKKKAAGLKHIARELLHRYQGRVPDDLDELLTLKGVGRKTANLVLTQGYGLPGICVDTHVHRITNRLGYLKTKTPEETEFALRKKLPGKYWIVINDYLVAYGQNICTPISPHCSRCRLAPYCKKSGVERHR